LPENDSACSTRRVTGWIASDPRHLTAWLQSYTGHPAYPLDQLGDDCTASLSPWRQRRRAPLFTRVMLGGRLPDRYRMPMRCALAIASCRVETPSFR
jgi:hypothetical protein